jgi:hypothetical protein
MMDTETGEFTEKTLLHEGNTVREFYAALQGKVVVGMEATGAMQWFLELSIRIVMLWSPNPAIPMPHSSWQSL